MDGVGLLFFRVLNPFADVDSLRPDLLHHLSQSFLELRSGLLLSLSLVRHDDKTLKRALERSCENPRYDSNMPQGNVARCKHFYEWKT